jgi:hypothetical protein
MDIEFSFRRERIAVTSILLNKVLLFGLLLGLGSTLTSRTVARENPQLEKIEWSDVWVANANQNDLPRVLMVGDSIVQGYFRDVEKDLAGKAYCSKYATSKFLGNPDYIEELKLLLKRYRFQVIHVNNGLHGWTYTEDQYHRALPKLMETLAKYAKGTTIVWATCTPRRNPQNTTQLAVDNDRVMERNRIAVDYMTRHGIAVDDLYSLVADHPEYYNLPQDSTHFNAQGREIEGKQVSEVLLQSLAGKTPRGRGK